MSQGQKPEKTAGNAAKGNDWHKTAKITEVSIVCGFVMKPQ